MQDKTVRPEMWSKLGQSRELQDHRLLCLAADWAENGHQLAIAFVIHTWGSSPRQVGSIMIIRQDLEIAGSVSGGCIEGAVIEAGLEALKSGEGQRLDFGVADETAWEVGLSCGGQISVLVLPVADAGLPVTFLQEVRSVIEHRRKVTFSIDVKAASIRDTAVKDIEQGQSLLDEKTGLFHFIQVPPPRLIIIGAVHITQYLSSMATKTGFQVVVIDPRPVFATQQRFGPDIDLQLVWPSDYFADHHVDGSTALVTLTHDPKIDDDALECVLDKSLFYLSCLGSSRTHQKRLKRLREAGATERALAKIKGPAGLPIGAKTPAEIAVSVLAELISAWRKSTNRSDKKQHIEGN